MKHPRKAAAGSPSRRRPTAPRAHSGTGKAALTLRLDTPRFRRLQLLAAAENRTPTNWVETVVLRELQARDEARRIITVAVAPELQGVPPGELLRSEGESDERYAARRAVFQELLAIPDDA